MSLTGRRLAFDYGDARIGVAISDFHCILSTPLPFISNDDNLVSALKEIYSEYEPVLTYVGNPLHLSGESGTAADKVRNFLHILAEVTDNELRLVDERKSTITAANKLREAGISAKDQKSLIDSMSAVGILDQALESEKKIQAQGNV